MLRAILAALVCLLRLRPSMAKTVRSERNRSDDRLSDFLETETNRLWFSLRRILESDCLGAIQGACLQSRGVQRRSSRHHRPEQSQARARGPSEPRASDSD